MDISGLILSYGYPLLFVLVFVEGPIATMTAAFLAALGYLNPFLVYCVAVIADIFADIFWYCVGYFGREKVVKKWGKYIGLTVGRIEKIEKIFGKHQGKILFISKITHAIGLPFLIAAGLSKINFRKFCFFISIATILKSLILVIIGYYFGQANLVISNLLDNGSKIGFMVLAFALLMFILFQRLMGKYFKNYE